MERPDFYLHHGAISVSNMKRSLEFYKRVLGFEEDTRVNTPDGSLEIVHVKRGEDFLELFCHRSPDPLPDFAKDNMADFKVLGTKHIAFSTDDADGMYRFLEKQNVDGLSLIFDNNPTYRYFFFRDPDGIALEFVERRT